MPRGAKLSIIGSGHAHPRIFRFPPPEQNTTTQQHNTMKRRLATANRQAELYQCGHHEKVSHHAHLAYAHYLHAKQHAEEAAKAHMKNYLDDSH